MTESDVAGWVFTTKDGTQWAVEADSKEHALQIFSDTAPSEASVTDEHSIPRADASRYELRPNEAVLQKGDV